MLKLEEQLIRWRIGTNVESFFGVLNACSALGCCTDDVACMLGDISVGCVTQCRTSKWLSRRGIILLASRHDDVCTLGRSGELWSIVVEASGRRPVVGVGTWSCSRGVGVRSWNLGVGPRWRRQLAIELHRRSIHHRENTNSSWPRSLWNKEAYVRNLFSIERQDKETKIVKCGRCFFAK
jgi:hypothetical protein